MSSKQNAAPHQSPITVYFDVSSLNPKKVTGVGVYILRLLAELQKHDNLKVIPVMKLSRIKNCPQIERLISHKVSLIWPWTGLFKKKALYHGPDFKIQMNSFIPRIVTVHDLVVFEGKYNEPAFFKKGIKDLSQVLNSNPDMILVNSEFTKQEALKYFPELAAKTEVTLLGCDRIKQDSPRLNLPESFILFLGTLEKRKNALGVISAFEELCRRGRPENLVLAGTWGFGSEEIKKALENSPFKERITHLNYVSNETVNALFNQAKVFVYPSWYEGFGIPALEAMALGCPVVTSSGGALEEVTGDAALHANPAQPTEIADAIMKLLTDEKLRTEQIERGHQKAASYTWKKCADKTIELYQKVINQVPG